MAPHFASFVLLALALYVSVCHADVSELRYNRFGRPSTRLQRQQLEPYPASGYRPDRQFSLPSEPSQFIPSAEAHQNGFNAGRPDALYGAPATVNSNARLRQAAARAVAALARQTFQPQQTYAAPQRTYGAPTATEPEAERLSAPQLARLNSNREDQEDDDDAVAATDIEVDAKAAAPKQPANVVPATATVAYYPAGAVGFVHPLAAYYQPAYASANYYAQLHAQSAALAAAAAASAPESAAAAAPAASAAATPATSAAPGAPAVAAASAPAAAAAFAPPYLAAPLLQQQLSYAIPAQLQAW